MSVCILSAMANFDCRLTGDSESRRPTVQCTEDNVNPPVEEIKEILITLNDPYERLRKILQKVAQNGEVSNTPYLNPHEAVDPPPDIQVQCTEDNENILIEEIKDVLITEHDPSEKFKKMLLVVCNSPGP
ncbi:uncharacterized protein LOC110981798 isoform X2 [Acanthaster planci]|uniref:Uncharacterized protein LOC110981798 isoform X2 n=1 Tax=Acanthaster planci TaxID=133434 RepID=A0A8B7YVS2_ACAPL|nr:uncharacterized protein LOC110981798 isoform X2 [Acanthaster planci]XP_022095411.1 uncharacterized protein LOC110981798 isoform X2 [Acanthaster planci]XP_022095412.1 uncharacterized protein LOC110981798 isoform X2 [Acanthaster planci]XP_022095414.1 uncharacterized protein LOC110981798 isoform X2 [Acanthaster planci]